MKTPLDLQIHPCGLDDLSSELTALLDKSLESRHRLRADQEGTLDPARIHTEAYLRQLVEAPSLVFLVARQSSGPVGFLLGRIEGAALILENLYVRPEQRRRGIAEALLLASEAEARGRGLTEVSLELEGDNTVQGLYARHGYAIEKIGLKKGL